MTECIKIEYLSPEERSLAVFAQGVLNRKGYKILIDCDVYRSYVKDETANIGLWELLKKYARVFTGAVAYDLDCEDVSVNMAATVCAVEDFLGVPRALLNKVNALGIETVLDMSAVKGSRAERQRKIFVDYRDRLKKDGVVHQVVKKGNFHLTLRDYSIRNGWLCFYTSENEEDRSFRREVLQWLDCNSPVYGWNDDEIAFIKDISRYGNYAVPTDWSSNHSYFGKGDRSVFQSPKRLPVPKDKHYLCFVVSDGDNVQWLERDFATTGTFGQRQASAYDYKLNWTISPSLVAVCPEALENIYSTKKHDYFISGVSGIGYANCLSYPREHLDAFTQKTSEYMKRSGLKEICLLDNVENTRDESFVNDRLSSYTRFSNVNGGIWELDPDRYGSGKGKIFVCDGKPFVSVRFTMWHPSGDMSKVDKKWLDGIVEDINSTIVDPHSEKGYSVVNVHPWTISMQSLDYVVSRLDAHVELVYVDELLGLIQKNMLK